MSNVTDEQVLADRLDLEMLERPHLWPGRGGKPTINLKRDPEGYGLCMQAQDGSYRLWEYIGASFELKEPPTMFATAQAIVDAGWRVD